MSDPREPSPSPSDQDAEERPSCDAPLEGRLDALTRGVALESLESLLGEVLGQEAWASACRRAYAPIDRPLSFKVLERVAEELARDEEAVALVGASLAVRVRTYRMLAASGRLGSFLGEAQS
ncbi:MAG: hypothetical protein AAGN46_15820 [Acidobacteriota bacterium]